MPVRPAGIPGNIVPGYSTCFYCDDVVVDARAFTIAPDSSGAFRVMACRKRRCRDAARDGAMVREDV